MVLVSGAHHAIWNQIFLVGISFCYLLLVAAIKQPAEIVSISTHFHQSGLFLVAVILLPENCHHFPALRAILSAVHYQVDAHPACVPLFSEGRRILKYLSSTKQDSE